MLLAIDMNEYDSRNMFVTDSIRNTVIDNSSFIRILYSTPDMTLNGITMVVPFNNHQINRHYSKWRCVFPAAANTALIERIQHLERDMLERINIEHKIPCHRLGEQVSNGFVKIFLEDTAGRAAEHSVLLKISGIWVTEQDYGITYKFLLAS